MCGDESPSMLTIDPVKHDLVKMVYACFDVSVETGTVYGVLPSRSRVLVLRTLEFGTCRTSVPTRTVTRW
jgi:hypothetical protein